RPGVGLRLRPRLHSVADGTAHAGAGERAVFRVPGAGGRVHVIERELILAARVVEVELLLAHRPVAAEAGAGERVRVLARRGRVGPELCLQQTDLGLELGEEDRIAAGQAHRRPTPFAVRGDV